jgi:hypothetical protein
MSEGNNSQRPTEVIKVSVDSSQMKALLESNAVLTKKLEKAEQGEQMFEHIRLKLAEKYEQEGLEVPHIENLSQLNSATENIKQITESKRPKNVPAGTVPLSSQIPVKTQEGYGSNEEMIDAVNQNKDVRNALLFKVLNGVKEGKLSLPSYEEPQPETTTSDLSPQLKLSVKPDPMGIERRFRTKKLQERASKGDQQAVEILNSGNY